MMFIGLAHAQPLPVGQTPQADPFESNPTAYVLTGFTATYVPAATAPQMYDGDLALGGSIKTFTTLLTTPTSASVDLTTFTTTPAPTYDPGWVEIKIKLDYTSAVTSSPDTFTIQYAVGASAFATLLPTMSLSTAIPASIRPYSQLANPNGGGWTWADIAGLKVRLLFTKVGSWDAKTMIVYEVWATVHQGPAPTYASPTLSVQPHNVASLATDAPPLIFVEVYASQFTGLWGYQFRLTFDTNVLTPMEAWTFYPFVSQAVADQLDDTNGFVELAYYTFAGDTVGFTGNGPIARIYFMLDQAENAGSSPLHFTTAIMSDTVGGQITAGTMDGGYNFGAVPEFPLGMGLIMLLAPLAPIAYLWRTRRKVIKK